MTLKKPEKKQTFEDYLQEKHAEQYVGTGDMIVDDFNDWIQDLPVDDWIKFGDAYHDQEIKCLEDKLLAFSKATCLICGRPMTDRMDIPPEECPYCRCNRLQQEIKRLKDKIPSEGEMRKLETAISYVTCQCSIGQNVYCPKCEGANVLVRLTALAKRLEEVRDDTTTKMPDM